MLTKSVYFVLSFKKKSVSSHKGFLCSSYFFNFTFQVCCIKCIIVNNSHSVIVAFMLSLIKL